MVEFRYKETEGVGICMTLMLYKSSKPKKAWLSIKKYIHKSLPAAKPQTYRRPIAVC